MRAPVSLVALIALAGCGDSKISEPEPGNGGQPAPAVAPATDAADALDISEDQAEAREFAWEGRFAASRELCEGGVWDISERRIVTAGETACDVAHVARAAGQVTLELSCIAEGMPGNERWTLTPQADGGMRVRRATAMETSDVDLIRCG